MVFLGAEPEETLYLQSTEVMQTLETCMATMLEEYAEYQRKADGSKPENPVKFMAAWLKANNPKRNAEMAARVAQMKEAGPAHLSSESAEALPEYGDAENVAATKVQAISRGRKARAPS